MKQNRLAHHFRMNNFDCLFTLHRGSSFFVGGKNETKTNENDETAKVKNESEFFLFQVKCLVIIIDIAPNSFEIVGSKRTNDKREIKKIVVIFVEIKN